MKDKKILVLGSNGLVGSSIVREMESQGYSQVLTPKRAELDLIDGSAVNHYFKHNKPEYVIDAAAKVGGIYANNTYRADFILQNLTIQNNLFNASLEYDVDKFLFLGSSCIYPKHSEQPIKEDYLLTGSLEPTNEPYAIAKIAGLKTAESIRNQYGKTFFSVMPTNLYGMNDNFHPENSHVIPGLIHRMHETIKNDKKTFEIWGSGSPKREFLYVDDLARACLFLLGVENPPNIVNVGYGSDVSIKELASLIAEKMNFQGEFIFNMEYPDGTPRKLLDSSRIFNLGWKPVEDLSSGLDKTIDFYLTSL